MPCWKIVFNILVYLLEAPLPCPFSYAWFEDFGNPSTAALSGAVDEFSKSSNQAYYKEQGSGDWSKCMRRLRTLFSTAYSCPATSSISTHNIVYAYFLCTYPWRTRCRLARPQPFSLCPSFVDSSCETGRAIVIFYEGESRLRPNTWYSHVTAIKN